MDFTRFCKSQTLLKLQLFAKAPETFCRFTTKPLLCGSALRKSSHLAMWPLGAVAGAGGANSGELVAGLAGEGGEVD
jgi:hypothetical protein